MAIKFTISHVDTAQLNRGMVTIIYAEHLVPVTEGEHVIMTKEEYERIVLKKQEKKDGE